MSEMISALEYNSKESCLSVTSRTGKIETRRRGTKEAGDGSDSSIVK